MSGRVEVLQAKIILDEKIVIEQNALLGKECSTKKEKKRDFRKNKDFWISPWATYAMYYYFTSADHAGMLPSISG